MAKKSSWPEKNPETSAYGTETTPLSTTAPGGDPRPGVNDIVPASDPANPVGYTGMERGGKRRKR
jgi:hypothetical protein